MIFKKSLPTNLCKLLLFIIAFIVGCQPEVNVKEEKAKLIELVDAKIERVDKEQENIRNEYGHRTNPDHPEAERVLVTYMTNLNKFKRSLLVMRKILMDERETDIHRLRRNTRALILRIDKKIAQTQNDLKGIPLKDQNK